MKQENKLTEKQKAEIRKNVEAAFLKAFGFDALTIQNGKVELNADATIEQVTQIQDTVEKLKKDNEGNNNEEH